VAAWYPDERDHVGPEHLDPEYVAAYDARTQLDVEEALALPRPLSIVERDVRGGIYATYVCAAR
jgi:hypothetical protein